jgi:hypothetical protein
MSDQQLSNRVADNSPAQNSREGGVESPAVHEGGGELIAEVASGNMAPETNAWVPQFVAPINLEIPASNQALSSFKFVNPFDRSGAVEGVQKQQSVVCLGLPPAAPEPRAGSVRSRPLGAEEEPFSSMSASALANKIGGKITTFQPELWISEDVSGAAFLEVVTPSSLPGFLENSMKIASIFTRLRVERLVTQLIQADKSLSAEVEQRWAPPIELAAADKLSTPSVSVSKENVHPQALFRSPDDHNRPRAPAHVASFLSEFKEHGNFSLDDSTLFNSPISTQARTNDNLLVTPQFSVGCSGAVMQAASGAMPLAITIMQPSAALPKYQILENTDNEEQFFSWLRKNRKETALAAKQDKRPLTELLTYDAKLEVARIIQKAVTQDVDLFDVGSPYPHREWASVTETLLLKCLFKVNGPRSATDAKARLKKKQFHFNDAANEQKYFTPKLRKHVKEFNQTLHDFKYCSRLWPEHDKQLTHLMIVEAFNEGFASNETTKGPDGRTDVPKCSNLSIIREKIRENKTKTLEEICDLLISHFERQDDIIKANRAEYPVKPWRTQTEKKKRAFNQVSAGDAPEQAARKARPPAAFPRCNNCGSKGHACGERTCYLFGHPKGLGANGNWPEGTPSLNLNPTEWKDWRKVRHDIFYAYPENKGKARGA